MHYIFLADIVVLVHFGFVLFVVLGALLVLRWRSIAWVHLPAVFWAAWIELSGGFCPLTPFENWLRLKGGVSAYCGGFVAHYLLPILYPSGLTRKLQIILGVSVVAVNVALYGVVIIFGRKKGGNT
jgi:hypothetical protein